MAAKIAMELNLLKWLLNIWLRINNKVNLQILEVKRNIKSDKLRQYLIIGKWDHQYQWVHADLLIFLSLIKAMLTRSHKMHFLLGII